MGWPKCKTSKVHGTPVWNTGLESVTFSVKVILILCQLDVCVYLVNTLARFDMTNASHDLRKWHNRQDTDQILWIERGCAPGALGERLLAAGNQNRELLTNYSVFDFFSQRHNKLCHFISDIMDHSLAGEDQQQTNQPTRLPGNDQADG